MKLGTAGQQIRVLDRDGSTPPIPSNGRRDLVQGLRIVVKPLDAQNVGRADRMTPEAVLRKAAQGLRDSEQVVLDPWHLFEDAHGDEVMADEGPCRACALGHIVWATVGAAFPVDVETAVLDALGQHLGDNRIEDLTMRLRDEGPAAVADLYERVADGLVQA